MHGVPAQRAHFVLRRSAPATPSDSTPSARTVEDGDLLLDLHGGVATRGGKPLDLTPREYALLVEFMTHLGELLSREAILKDVWDWKCGDASTVTGHVRRLREKVESDPSAPSRLLSVHSSCW